MSTSSSDSRAHDRRLEPKDLIRTYHATWKVFRNVLEAEFTGIPTFEEASKRTFNLLRAIWEYRHDWQRYRGNSILVVLDDSRSMMLRKRLDNCKEVVDTLAKCVSEAHKAVTETPMETVLLSHADMKKLEDLTISIGEYADYLKRFLRTNNREAERLEKHHIDISIFQKVEKRLRDMEKDYDTDGNANPTQQWPDTWQSIQRVFYDAGLSQRDFLVNKDFLDDFMERLLDNSPVDESDRLTQRYPPVNPSTRRYDPRPQPNEIPVHPTSYQPPRSSGNFEKAVRFETMEAPIHRRRRDSVHRSQANICVDSVTSPQSEDDVRRGHRTSDYYGPRRPVPQMYPRTGHPDQHRQSRRQARLWAQLQSDKQKEEEARHGRSEYRFPPRGAAPEAEYPPSRDASSVGSGSPSTQTSGLASDLNYVPQNPSQTWSQYWQMREAEETYLDNSRRQTMSERERMLREENPEVQSARRIWAQQMEEDEKRYLEEIRARTARINAERVRIEQEQHQLAAQQQREAEERHHAEQRQNERRAEQEARNRIAGERARVGAPEEPQGETLAVRQARRERMQQYRQDLVQRDMERLDIRDGRRDGGRRVGDRGHRRGNGSHGSHSSFESDLSNRSYDRGGQDRTSRY